MPDTLPTGVLVQMKECELCRQSVQVISETEAGRELAFDIPSGEEHECWVLPPGHPELLVMQDEDAHAITEAHMSDDDSDCC